jgi:aspartyl-tRNA synthetase
MGTPMQTSYRTLTCADARLDHAGQAATLAGWVNRRRDLGQLIFLDLRDRYGIMQVVIDAAESPLAHEVASSVRSEYVLRVRGTIAPRTVGSENARLATGQVELRASEITVLSEARTPPFVVNDPEAEIDEALRLKYRYLDLRREPLQQRILARGRLVQAIRDVHHEAGFVEVETPLLIKSTPEGARDFIVPSRLQPGSVYALPQSPQQLKQLLMVSGFDRYFQIARCLRDEDLRGDRQPEFTQLDLEMSFVAEDDVMAWVEHMVLAVTRAVAPERQLLTEPFPRYTYREAIDRFGSDKPDVRYGMELHDLGELAAASGFRVFEAVLAEHGRVVGMAVPGQADMSRAQIDELTELARRAGAKGLVWLATDGEGGIRGSIIKVVGEEMARRLASAAGGGPGDLVLIVADADIHAQEALGSLRVKLADRLAAYDRSLLSYVWIHHFPMYQWDEHFRRWDATHNPFSAVHPEDQALLVTDSGDPLVASPGDPAGRARALQYDIALNGWELGGGSVRFHTREMLSRSFSLQGHSLAAQEAKFSGILEAFEYGAPPHGGIALGVDRWIALLTDQSNIREVMAFPKTSSGSDLMLDAPSPVEPEQLEELGLMLRPAKPAAG